MVGLTISQYARHRQDRRLPGQSSAAVKKALATGRIACLPTGRIDPAAADAAWARNTDPAKQHADAEAPSTVVHAAVPPAKDNREVFEAGFQQGKCWLAKKLAIVARREWPKFIFEVGLFDKLPPEERIVARATEVSLLIHLVEGWLGDHLAGVTLPAPDWSPFGTDAERMARESEDVRQYWSGLSAESEE